MADPRTVEGAQEALEALRASWAPCPNQRVDFALQVAGSSYPEIAEITGDRTFTNVYLG
jgi:hypothetical protein